MDSFYLINSAELMKIKSLL